LYVLLEGSLRVEKGGVQVASIADSGACVGELSLLLDVPATADVVAAEPSVVAVVEDAPRLLSENPELALALARLLATRVQHMTTYLADLQHQYADHEGGLGMVGTVLGRLMHRPQGRSELGSARDPDPEY
jgi:CRP-like cAMP-binding protein